MFKSTAISSSVSSSTLPLISYTPSGFNFYWEVNSHARVGSMSEFNISGSSSVSASLINISTDYTNGHLIDLTLGNLPALTKLVCDKNQLTMLNLDRCPSLTTVVCSNNKLESLRCRLNENLLILEANNNNFNQYTVDLILGNLNSFNTTSGSVDLGGTGNLPPTTNGISSKLLLKSRGWTVITN